MQASIIHTVDGGNTWTRMTGVPSGTSLSYQSIFFEASGTLRWSVNAGETASPLFPRGVSAGSTSRG
jgi:hypothetical protein